MDNSAAGLAASVETMRPFLPSKDFQASQQFYQALGFEIELLGDKLAHAHLPGSSGRITFLLQDYYVREFAENLMMHVLVDDLDLWWRQIESASLERFGVEAPRAPKLEPWGLRVAYVFDPSGVLWHFAERA